MPDTTKSPYEAQEKRFNAAQGRVDDLILELKEASHPMHLDDNPAQYRARIAELVGQLGAACLALPAEWVIFSEQTGKIREELRAKDLQERR